MRDGLSNIVTPVYFPFTHLTESVAACLQACFQSCVVYSLSDQQLTERRHRPFGADRLDIHVQRQVDGEMLERVFSGYQSWAGLHPEGIGAYLKAQGSQVPHFDDQSVSRIAEAVRCQGTPSSTDEEDDRALLKAGLFLYAAEKYDIYMEETDNSLHRLAEKEQDFIAGLREAGDVLYRRQDSGGTATWEDTGRYMTGERILSWIRLVADDLLPNAIFVTTSPAVLDYLREMTDDMRLAMETTFVSPSHPDYVASEQPPNQLRAVLKRLVEDPRGLGRLPLEIPNPALLWDNGPRGFSFTLYAASDRKPLDYFGNMAGFLFPRPANQPDERGGAGTLIGLIQPV